MSTDPAMETYLGALASFDQASGRAYHAFKQAEGTEKDTDEGLQRLSDDRRTTVDETLTRSNAAQDLIREVRERTGARQVPRQIASSGLAFPDWATAEDNLHASESRLENAEKQLENAERALRRWEERRNRRARWIIWLAVVTAGVVVALAFLGDFAARYPFFSLATFLLLVVGALVVTGAGLAVGVLAKHPELTAGPPLRTHVNTEGLLTVGRRIVLPVFVLLLALRIVAGIYLTLAHLLGG